MKFLDGLKLLKEALKYINSRHQHYKLIESGVTQEAPCEQCELASRIDAHLASGGEVSVDQGCFHIARQGISGRSMVRGI